MFYVRSGRSRKPRTRSRAPSAADFVQQLDEEATPVAAHEATPAAPPTPATPQPALAVPDVPSDRAAQLPSSNAFSVDQPRRQLRRHSTQRTYRDKRAQANLRCNLLHPIVEAISEPTDVAGLPHAHMLVMHNSIDPVRNPKRRATCKHCALSFPSRNALYKHLQLCVLPKVLQHIDTLEQQLPRVLHCQGVTIAAAALLLADADSLLTDASNPPLPPTDYRPAADGSYDKLTLEEAGPLIIGGAPFGMQVTVSNEQRSRSKALVAYYDSGGPSSVISPELLKELNITPDETNGGRKQRLVFTGFTSGERFATQTAVVRLKVGQEKIRNVRFWVCAGSPVPLLVGADNMTGPGAECYIDCNLTRPTLSFKDSHHTYLAVKSLQPEAATFLADTIIPPLSEMIVQIQTRAYNTQLLLSQAWISSTLFTSGRQVVVRTDNDGRALVPVTNADIEPVMLYDQTPLIMTKAPTLLISCGTTPTTHATASRPVHTTSHSDLAPRSEAQDAAPQTPSEVCSQQPPVADPSVHASTDWTAPVDVPTAAPTLAAPTPMLHAACTPTTPTPTDLSNEPPDESEVVADHCVAPLTPGPPPASSEELKRGSTWGNKGKLDEVTEKAYLSKDELRAHLAQHVKDNVLLSDPQRLRLTRCLHDNLAAFSDEETPIGHIVGHDYSFNMITPNPIFVPSRFQSPAVAQETERQVMELVRNGTMHPTTSEFNFPVTLVRKSPGSAPRLCIDTRELNKKFIGEYTKVPCIKECLAKISQAKVFSALDSTASFHMIGLNEHDGPVPSAHVVAITLQSGKRFAFRKLPFGLKQATSTFQRVMNGIMLPFAAESTVYVDDVTLMAQSMDGQIDLLERVLPALIKAGVRLNPKKTALCKTKIDVLGHTVSHNRIEIHKDKLAAIANLQPPRDRKELQALIGVLSWSRRFVHDYAAIAEPMTRLLRKGAPSVWPAAWGASQHAAFKKLQRALIDKASLAAPDFSLPFEVLCDASATGIGAVLMQSNAQGEKSVIEFYSKQLTDAERKWCTAEREAFAILSGLTKFRQYILMAQNFKVVVRSDHRGLTSLYKHADDSSRLYRWAQQLEDYDYKIEWLAGKSEQAMLPDGLSRARVLFNAATTSCRRQVILQEVAAWVDNPDSPWQDLNSTSADTDAAATTLLGQTRRPRKMPPRPTPEFTGPAVVPVCSKKKYCFFPHGHKGRCKKPPPDKDGPDIDEPRFEYDHIVCRAHRNGIQGFRMRWRGYDSTGDTYETLHRMRREVDQLAVDQLISDFVRRERSGDIDVETQPCEKFAAWKNVIAAHAPAPRHTAGRKPTLSPFPGATPNSDSGFLAFDGVDLPQLLQHQRAEPDTKDFLRFIEQPTHFPAELSPSARHNWVTYARSLHIDPDTQLLMRKFEGTTGPHRGLAMEAIVLPLTLLDRAFTWSHDLQGHQGVHATLWNIRKRFNCFKLEEHLRHYISACDLCTRADRDARKNPYGSIPIHQFSDAIGFDFYGPLKGLGPNGEKFCCVMIDHASKYTICYPTHGETAKDAVAALTHWILTMGTMPKTIFSDQGAFTGIHQVWVALLARFGINSHRAMSKNPRGDGHAEQGVRQINRILKKIIQDNPNSWPDAAKWACYCLNTKYQSTIGTSPFYAIHAIEPRLPIDFLMPRISNSPAPKSITDLADMIDRVNVAVQRGVEKLHNSYALRNKELRGVRDFQAGDLVYKHRVYPESFKVAGIDKKYHLPFYPEPYVVLQRRSDYHSRIRLAYNDNAPYEDIHHQRLKFCVPYNDAIQFRFAAPIPPPSKDA